MKLVTDTLGGALSNKVERLERIRAKRRPQTRETPVHVESGHSGNFRSRQGTAKEGSSLLRDQRGAVAFEMPFVYLFLILLFFMPLADLATFGFQFISAYEALRNLGQYAQYHDPTDVTNWSSWASGLPSTGYSISVQLVCGDTNQACSATNTASPKYYTFSTTITLSPLVLRSVLCSNAACTYTLNYSERFQ